MAKQPTAWMKEEHTVKVNGIDVTYHKIENDINGNPRIVVHFLQLAMKLADYGRVPGLTKYRAKWFGGGYVMQAWRVEEDLEWCLKQVEKYYEKKGAVQHA